MLAASENNFISDADPHYYLPQVISKLGDDAVAIFQSNVLPLPDQFDYACADLDTFLDARAPIVEKLVSELCEGTS